MCVSERSPSLSARLPCRKGHRRSISCSQPGPRSRAPHPEPLWPFAWRESTSTIVPVRTKWHDGVASTTVSEVFRVRWSPAIACEHLCWVLLVHLPHGAGRLSRASLLSADKEERQGWGLLLLICPRGSLGISINLQISGPVLLAWAVIANLFLLDGRARRCLMSRLGLYLGAGEQAGSRGDAGALQDFWCLFVFFCWNPAAFLLLCKEFCMGWICFCFIYSFSYHHINILRVKEKLF